MGDLREPNGGVVEERPLSLPSPSLIGPERWDKAEKVTEKIICKVQPTRVSEERRREVVDYVQRLIRGSLGCEVFPYGSVPLKTYLPDGDIDLTAFGGTNIEDVLANDMVSVLEGEDQNEAAEFVVKDVQLIRAEVKLVKCIVQNIVVDISINQIGGLCTLCFLEQEIGDLWFSVFKGSLLAEDLKKENLFYLANTVDRLIGKDHIFKRSVILIKAWCYYESRILGAHHGLISTYALETLVLYIFHLFHSKLDGPLAVLYKFLDYFSKFDWENYCISLTGPVRISSLPEIVAETPENDGGDLLLSSDFLRYSMDMFSVPSRGMDMGSRTFPQKHLNIVDPLKENNNLGRSVSKGNFYRIRSAFAYGARKLGRILLQLEDDIADELHKFFSNTLERHGHGQRPDVQDSGPLFNSSPFIPSPEVPESVSSQAAEVIPERQVTDLSAPEDSRINPDASSHDVVDATKVSRTGTIFCMVHGEQERIKEEYHSTMSSETNGHLVGTVEGHRHLENGEDLTRSEIQGLMISNDLPKISASSVEASVSARGKPYHAPHLYFTNSLFCNGEVNSDPMQFGKCKENIYSKISQGSDDIDCVPDENLMVGKHEILAGGSNASVAPILIPFSEDNSYTARGASSSGSPESTDSLSDLSGDYDSHFSYLQYGRWSYEHGLGVPVLSIPQPQPHFQISWDAIQHPPRFKRGYSHGNANGVIPSSAIYTMNALVMPEVAFGLEEMPKPRGTGTYFPNMNRPPQGYRPSAVRGRNQAPSRSPRNNGWNTTIIESSNHDRSSRESPQYEVPFEQSGVKHGTSDVQQSFSSRGKGHSKVNGLFVQSEGFVEFGSVGQVPPERSRQQRLASSSPNSAPVSPTLGTQRLKPVFSRDHDRVSMKSSYRLKDEDDFPALPV